jgi:hypothetical protein
MGRINKDHYEILGEKNHLVINRKVFPRISLHLNCENTEPQIIKVKLLDKCSATVIAPALAELDELVSRITSSVYETLLSSVTENEISYHVY